MEIKVMIKSKENSVEMVKNIEDKEFYTVVGNINEVLNKHDNVTKKEVVKEVIKEQSPEKLVFFRCDVCGYLGFSKTKEFPATFVCRNCKCAHVVNQNKVSHVEVTCDDCGKRSVFYTDTTVDGIKCKACGKPLTEKEAKPLCL